MHRPATMYCIDCRQNYCDSCIATHEVINPLVCHRIIERGKPRPIKELLLSSSLDRCDTHVDKQLEIYCKICRKAICFLCSVETPHHSHDRIQVVVVSYADNLIPITKYVKIRYNSLKIRYLTSSRVYRARARACCSVYQWSYLVSFAPSFPPGLRSWTPPLVPTLT